MNNGNGSNKSRKRSSPSSESESPDSKKPKHEEFTLLKKIIVRNDCDPYIITEAPATYVKIGTYIYKVKKPTDESSSDLLSMTLTQYNDVKKYIFGKNNIMISGYFVKPPFIEKLFISLTSDTNFKILTDKEDIIDHIKQLLHRQIVTIEQRFITNYMGINITIAIDGMDNMTVGKIGKKTKIDFKYFAPNIIICNQCVPVRSKSVRVSITKCIDLNNSDMNVDDDCELNTKSKFPLLVENSTMDKYIRSAIKEKFTDGDTLAFSVNCFEYTVHIRIIDSNKQTKYKNTYKLKSDDNLMQIESNTSNVIITEGKKTANKICFDCLSAPMQKYDMEDLILPREMLTKHIFQNIKNVTDDQSFKFYHNDKEITLRIDYINPRSTKELMYEINEKTKISFNNDKKSKFFIVRNTEPLEVEKVIFKIKQASAGGFFAFLFGGSDKKTLFDAKKLEKIVKEAFPKKTVVGQQMKISSGGHQCIVKVKELIFKDKEATTTTKKKYGLMGMISDETEFKFETSRNDKNLILHTTNKATLLKNPIEELKKHVGGISNQIKKMVSTICLSRGKLREEFLARGLKAVKGFILYGPPGCGKTSVARQLGKLLGCEGERFRLMSGPEIFNKWVGESEANVRAIFKPAKEAWKKHGANAPVYMVVIDEIDAMLPARGKSPGNSVRDTVVNQFLSEMDGLEEYNNLICVGITNRLEMLDPAAIRSGRFGIHIEIGLPNKNGRIDIFNIHTKKLSELGRLSNIDFVKLADLTDKMSGADIESIVELASTRSMERLNDRPEEISKELIDAHGKITMEDFLKAIEETKETNKDDSEIIKHLFT